MKKILLFLLWCVLRTYAVFRPNNKDYLAGPLHGDEWEFMDDYGNRKPHGTETPGD